MTDSWPAWPRQKGTENCKYNRNCVVFSEDSKDLGSWLLLAKMMLLEQRGAPDAMVMMNVLGRKGGVVET